MKLYAFKYFSSSCFMQRTAMGSKCLCDETVLVIFDETLSIKL